MNAVINEVTSEQLKSDRDHFKVGDGVRVHSRVKEGSKERIQVFAGVVIVELGHPELLLKARQFQYADQITGFVENLL